jgi:hypothetical protein
VRRLTPLLLTALALLRAGDARADSCGRPNLLVATPPDEATRVPTDAIPTARYASTAELVDELVRWGPEGDELTSVEPSFDSTTGTLSFVPPDGFEPDTSYIIEWPALRGLASAGRGRTETVSFRTGVGPDRDAPAFGGIEAVDWSPVRVLDDCTDRHEDRFEFELRLDTAHDDGGVELLDLVVFQTRGPFIDSGADGEGPRQVHVQRYQGESSKFRMPLEQAEGDVCFAAFVRDTTGKISASASREVCVKTKLPPIFEGCSVSRGTALGKPSARGTGWSGFGALLGIAALGVARRWRTQRT